MWRRARLFIQAGEPCINIVIILSGKASGVEWPMHGHSYLFKDFGPGDFLGEIESFAECGSTGSAWLR